MSSKQGEKLLIRNWEVELESQFATMLNRVDDETVKEIKEFIHHWMDVATTAERDRRAKVEDILRNALKDDYFADHTSGCWQLDAKKILSIHTYKDLFGEENDCENDDGDWFD